ncbi:MAG: triose-phosphate isomerase [Dehalococcoidia bacterium]|jgi:triosephosphate isomerase
MRVPMIAGNWKMNTTVDEAVNLVKSMLPDLNRIKGVEKVVCPPFVSLVSVGEILKNSSIQLGAQNMYYEEKGAYTGEVSPPMLAGLCDYVIIGHSERRLYFGETGDIVNKKVRAAIDVKVKPIMCVGETLEENEAGKTQEVLARQINDASDRMYFLSGTVIAYEPIWAIGTGRSATGAQANDTIGFIRQLVAHQHGNDIAESVRILYGGSVTADNISEIMGQTEIDGALVGGASLKADAFASIVQQTADIRGAA